MISIAPSISKSGTPTGIGYFKMKTSKIKKKMLKTYHKILKASVKRKYDRADDLNWKLLQLELKLRELDEEDGKS